MQTIWSRAAQTRSSCRCRACFAAATTTIARRTTTAGFSKRRLKFADVFTACYTSIIGTAVFLDSKAKQDRRKQWDQVITEARRGLDRVESPVDPNTEEVPAPKFQPRELETASERPIERPKTVWDGQRWVETPAQGVPLSGQLKLLDYHLRQSLAPSTVPSAIIVAPRRIMETIDDWAGDGEIWPPREPKYPINIEILQLEVAKLVSGMLLTSKSLKASFTGGDISMKMRQMADRIEDMESGQSQLPLYWNCNQELAETERRGLHNSLITIFEAWTPDCNIELMTAKICYNLLVSTAPPNITTFNILLDSLTRLRQHELGQYVADIIFQGTRYKPNSNTVCHLLDHYAAKKDDRGFRTIIKRMRVAGKRNNFGDMRLKKRTIDQVRENPKHQEWVLTSPIVQRDDVLHQVFLRNSKIFDSIITGYVKLENMRAAVSQLLGSIYLGLLNLKRLAEVVEALSATNPHNPENAKRLLTSMLAAWRNGYITAYDLSNVTFTRALKTLHAISRHSMEGFWSQNRREYRAIRSMCFLEGIAKDLRDYDILLSDVETAITAFEMAHLEPIVDAVEDASIWLSRARKALVFTDNKIMEKLKNTRIWCSFHITDRLWGRYFEKYGRFRGQADYRFGSRTAQETSYWYAQRIDAFLPLPKSTTTFNGVHESEGNLAAHETNMEQFPEGHIQIELEEPKAERPEPALLPLLPSFHSQVHTIFPDI